MKRVGSMVLNEISSSLPHFRFCIIYNKKQQNSGALDEPADVVIISNVKMIFSPVCLRVCLFSPPGLPDVAGPEKPGVPDERALHHPRERRPALAPPRPAQRPRLPRRQRAALRRRAGGGALLGAGGGARDPQREGQRALRTGGVWTAASETKIKEAQIKLSEETF